MAKKIKIEPCLTPICEGKRKSRGLCDACYATAKRDVFHGRTTWERLEDQGLCLPARRRIVRQVQNHKVKPDRKPRAQTTDSYQSVREWEKQYWKAWDAYFETRMGSTEVRQALDAAILK